MAKNDKKTITNVNRLSKHHHTDELSLPSGMDKNEVLLLVNKAYKQIGLNESQLKLYEYMIIHTQKVDWQAGNICICYASVEMIAEELEKSVRQVQNNTDALINAGLISLKLSGNYRRGGQRCRESGKLLWASGADLKPVIERLEELQQIVDMKKCDLQDKKRLCKSISSLSREMRSLIKNNCPDVWEQFASVINIRSRFSWAYERLETLYEHLQDIWQSLQDRLHEAEKEPNVHENCSHGRNKLPTLYKDTIQDKDSFVEPTANVEARGDTPHANYSPPDLREKRNGSVGVPVSLGMVLDVIRCNPQGVMQSAMHGLPSNLSSIVEAAHRSCKLLGISEHAWQEACQTMGVETAALSVASIDAKGAKVKNAGGYLRGMIRKNAEGKLKLSKTIQGLVRLDVC